MSANVGDLNSFGQFEGADSIYAHGAAGSYSTGLSSADLIATILAGLGDVFTNYSTVSRRPRAASIPQRHAVLARLGAADQDAAVAVDPNRLTAADRHVEHLDVVAAPREVGAYRLRDEMLGL